MFEGMFGTSGELYHVGMRAAHLESALDELSETHQVEWTEINERDFTVWEPGNGYRTYPLRLAFSRQGPIRLEILESIPGSHWDGRDVPGPHHLGVWVDDVGAEIERLSARGWSLEFAANSPEEGYGRFAYIRSPQGILFEPVDIANRPRFEAWWAGGELASHRS
jgi:catechol 2,3-dioxygenase-like lactoylglutathione lyase family enzyme